MTYFVQSIDGGPIKIGYSTNLLGRLKDMQTASPSQLVCLAYVEGNREAEFHDRFIASRVAGEWFTPTPELMELIEGFALTSLPARLPVAGPLRGDTARGGERGCGL